MRKLILFISLCLISIIIYTQPVLDYNNSVPTIGLTYTLHNVNADSLTTGINGVNVIWDYSNLVDLQDTFSYVFIDPASSPAWASFPGSNFCCHRSNGLYIYLNISNTSNDYYGHYTNSGNTYYYNNPKTIMTFPFTYNSIFSDHFLNDQGGGDSTSGNITTSCIAYGTLILPYGTFTDILKIREEQDVLSIVQGSVAYYISDIYYWFKPGIYEPLLTIASTNYMGTTYWNAHYLDENDISVYVDKLKNDNDLHIFPNPCKDLLNISSKQNFEIYSIDGQLIKQANSNRVDVSSLKNGIYFIKIGSTINKFVKN